MHNKCTVLLVVLAAGSSLAWPYGERTIKGMNVGSWLVLEKWITPGIFEGLPDSVDDEYRLCEYNRTEAQQRLRNHWDTWVTEADFEFWAGTGINHVRLPIGYWAVDIKADEPWVSGSWDYVVKAAEWCKKYGLQLMIDLHGAPGSQNGWDHSGRAGAIEFFTDENINRTVGVIGQIAQWSAAPEWRDTVSIIQLVNEPFLWDDYDNRFNRLKNFYSMAYHEVRKHNDIVVVAIHDAFINLSNWFYFNDLPEYYGVMLDTHRYQVFGDQWGPMTCEQHHQYPCSYHEELAASNEKIWTVVGEWSLATPNPCDGQDFFARQQIGAYEKGSGWFMWSHNNAQNYSEWSFKHSYANNWINPIGNNTPQCDNSNNAPQIYSTGICFIVSFLVLYLQAVGTNVFSLCK